MHKRTKGLGLAGVLALALAILLPATALASGTTIYGWFHRNDSNTSRTFIWDYTNQNSCHYPQFKLAAKFNLGTVTAQSVYIKSLTVTYSFYSSGGVIGESGTLVDEYGHSAALNDTNVHYPVDRTSTTFTVNKTFKFSTTSGIVLFYNSTVIGCGYNSSLQVGYNPTNPL